MIFLFWQIAKYVNEGNRRLLQDARTEVMLGSTEVRLFDTLFVFNKMLTSHVPIDWCLRCRRWFKQQKISRISQRVPHNFGKCFWKYTIYRSLTLSDLFVFSVLQQLTWHYGRWPQNDSYTVLYTVFWFSLMMGKEDWMQRALGQMNIDEKWKELDDEAKVCCLCSNHWFFYLECRSCAFRCITSHLQSSSQ